MDLSNQKVPEYVIFPIFLKKFLEDLALKRKAAGTPKDKGLRSPSPYAQQPRSPAWKKQAVQFEFKDDLPVAGEPN